MRLKSPDVFVTARREGKMGLQIAAESKELNLKDTTCIEARVAILTLIDSGTPDSDSESPSLP